MQKGQLFVVVNPSLNLQYGPRRVVHVQLPPLDRAAAKRYLGGKYLEDFPEEKSLPPFAELPAAFCPVINCCEFERVAVFPSKIW